MLATIKNNDFVKLAFGAVATLGAITTTMGTAAAFGAVANHIVGLPASGIGWSMLAGCVIGASASAAVFKKYKILEYTTG